MGAWEYDFRETEHDLKYVENYIEKNDISSFYELVVLTRKYDRVSLDTIIHNVDYLKTYINERNAEKQGKKTQEEIVNDKLDYILNSMDSLIEISREIADSLKNMSESEKKNEFLMTQADSAVSDLVELRDGMIEAIDLIDDLNNEGLTNG